MSASHNVPNATKYPKETISWQESDWPIFPQSDKDNQFIKDINNFHAKITVAMPDNEKHHQAHKYKKKPKPGKQNATRDSKDWYEVVNHSIQNVNAARQHQIINFASAAYRLGIGKFQPKYRTVKHEDGSQFPLSEGIPGYVDYFDYFDENIWPKEESGAPFDMNDVPEGLGRVLFYEYFNLEDDTHFGNLCLNKKKYVVGIDHDRSYAPLSLKLKLTHDHVKIIMRRKMFDANVSHVFIRGKTADDMGTVSLKDYENFPDIKNFTPNQWQFSVAPRYCSALAKNPRFLNEKHFSALKALVTETIEHALADLQVKNSEDCQDLHNMRTQRQTDFLNMLQGCSSFIDYVKTNRLAAIKTIIFETNNFLNADKHYLYKNSELAMLQRKSIATIIIKHFSELLPLLKLENLTLEEKAELNDFSDQISQSKLSDLKPIKEFYKSQHMNLLAQELETSDSLEMKTEATVKVFGLFPIPKIERISTLLQPEDKESSIQLSFLAN